MYTDNTFFWGGGVGGACIRYIHTKYHVLLRTVRARFCPTRPHPCSTHATTECARVHRVRYSLRNTPENSVVRIHRFPFKTHYSGNNNNNTSPGLITTIPRFSSEFLEFPYTPTLYRTKPPRSISRDDTGTVVLRAPQVTA